MTHKYRMSDLTEYVKEAFTEKNVRSDFIRILFQPSYSFSPFHFLSVHATETLAYLLNSFYSYCVVQRDYVNALKLHKITSVLIVNDSHHRFPLYGYLYSHDVYTKVGFWKELLIDYCLSHKDGEAAYRMRYNCVEDSQSVSIKRTKFTQSRVC